MVSLRFVTFLLVYFFASSLAFAKDNPKEILEKLRQKYSVSDKLYCEVRYELYKNVNEEQPLSNTPGLHYRNGRNAYQRIGATEMILTNDYFLQINGDDHLAVLSKADEHIMPENDLTSVLKACESIALIEERGMYFIQLDLKSFSNVPVNKVILAVDKRSYTLKFLDLYFSTVMDFSEEQASSELQYPRLKICYDLIDHKPKGHDELTNIEHYLTLSGNTYLLKDIYKGFEFIDKRTN